MKINFWLLALIGFRIFIAFTPELALAQFGGGGDLESKVHGVTNGLISFLLPAASIIGLVYAAILAATGDASARQRMVLVAVTSIIGMLAPLIIRWLQGMVM
jgi:hypothetical protein